MKIKNVVEVKNVETEIKKILKAEVSKSQKIKDLFDIGLEVKEIAEKLGIRYNFAYNVISNYIMINGIEIEQSNKETKKDQIKLLFSQGKSNKEICIELKTNYNYVCKIVKEIKQELLVEEVSADVK